MNTKLWVVENINDLSNSYPQLIQAAHLLKANEVVAFPTETVYGLGANAFSDIAVQKIYEAKGRPSDNPLIVHIATISMLERIVKDIPEYAYKLINEFWPGPLTIVLKKKGTELSNIVTAGLDTVAVRMPDHPIALSIIKEANLPIAAPSANQSGKPSPTLASHVTHDLNGKISGIVDGGPTGVGVESTVVDCTTAVPTILRPGGITKEQLENVIGSVNLDQALIEEGHIPKSPGMKYTHYAPDAPIIVIEGSLSFLQEQVNQFQKQGKRVGVLTTIECAPLLEADVVKACGSRKDLQSVAAQLYDVLRQFDREDVNIILSESFPQVGVGEAVMNRLMKAAGNQVMTEPR